MKRGMKRKDTVGEEGHKQSCRLALICSSCPGVSVIQDGEDKDGHVAEDDHPWCHALNLESLFSLFGYVRV